MNKEKAGRMEAWLEDHFIDPDGLVYTFLDKGTKRPPTEETFAGTGEPSSFQDWHINGFTRSEFAAYENCGMCAGAYLQALLLQFRLTGNSSALDRARRCFGAIKHVFAIGKLLEPGFFPKIYGGRFSPQTSTDQVLYAVTAMDAFHEFANANEKAEICAMIPSMVEFWVKRQYRYTYYQCVDMQWPLERFPSLLVLASKYSGDTSFKREYDRLLPLTAEPGNARITPKIKGKEQPIAFERQHHAWLANQLADAITMDVMQYDILLRHDPGNPLADSWRQGIRTMWDEAKLTLAPNGKYYHHVLVDMDTGEPRRTPGYSQDGTEFHGAQSGWSTMIIRGALMGLPYMLDCAEEIAEKTKPVLEKLDINDLTYYDEPERFAPKYRFKSRLLSGDAITNWLWAYWLNETLSDNARRTGI